MTTATNTVPETATLQMVRAEVNVREFQRWMGTRRLQDPDHAAHCLLIECFGDLAPKPFRLIVPRGGSMGCLYGYGQSDADELRESAAICADPLQTRIIPASTIDSKLMPAEWQTGKRLGFEVRVRPVVRLQKDLNRVPPDKQRLFRQDKRNGERECKPRPGMECDVFQWKALLYDKGKMPYTREQVYTEWLSDQLGRIRKDQNGRQIGLTGGASLDVERTKLVSFQRTRAFRKLHTRYSEGPDAVMRGVLTITDSAAFSDLLRQGIGRHRAYGYGMLLLRPARD